MTGKPISKDEPMTKLKYFACAAIMTKGDQMELVPAGINALSLEHAQEVVAGAFMKAKPGWMLASCVAWDSTLTASDVPLMHSIPGLEEKPT